MTIKTISAQVSRVFRPSFLGGMESFAFEIKAEASLSESDDPTVANDALLRMLERQAEAHKAAIEKDLRTLAQRRHLVQELEKAAAWPQRVQELTERQTTVEQDLATLGGAEVPDTTWQLISSRYNEGLPLASKDATEQHLLNVREWNTRQIENWTTKGPEAVEKYTAEINALPPYSVLIIISHISEPEEPTPAQPEETEAAEPEAPAQTEPAPVEETTTPVPPVPPITTEETPAPVTEEAAAPVVETPAETAPVATETEAPAATENTATPEASAGEVSSPS